MKKELPSRYSKARWKRNIYQENFEINWRTQRTTLHSEIEGTDHWNEMNGARGGDRRNGDRGHGPKSNCVIEEEEGSKITTGNCVLDFGCAPKLYPVGLLLSTDHCQFCTMNPHLTLF